MANPTPLKITTNLETRDGTSTTKDARITNLLVEQKGDETHFLKRPGFSLYNGTSALPGLGATLLPSGQIISFSGDPRVTSNATVLLSGSVTASGQGFDPVNKGAQIVLSNNNLTASTSTPFQDSIAVGTSFKTIGPSGGHWYAEGTFTGDRTGSTSGFGLAKSTIDVNSSYLGSSTTGYQYEYLNGLIMFNGSPLQSGLTVYFAGETISIVFDAVLGTLRFWRLGVAQGTLITGLTGSWTFGASAHGAAATNFTINSGQGLFSYAPPASYIGFTP